MTEESLKAVRPPLLNCELCDKQFGKPTKLERHLLEDHHAEFGISPGVLSPAQSTANFPSTSLISDLQQVLVKKALNNAVSEANRIFEAAEHSNLPHALCALCPPAHHKPFKNAKDLAQHILTKHNTDLSMDMDTTATAPAVLKAEPLPTRHATPTPLSTRSEISSNPAKRKLEPIVSQPRPRKDPKKSRLLAIDMSADTAVAPANASKTPVRAPVPAAKHESKTMDAAPIPTKQPTPNNSAPAPSIAKRGVSEKSPVNKSSTKKQNVTASPTASGTKPPTTPKKVPTGSAPKATAKRAAADANLNTNPVGTAACSTAPAASFPASMAVTTAPIDFTSIGGFTTNARKSYYRLSNR